MASRKNYAVSGDLKLNMPGVASKEAEVNIHVIEGTSNGTYITYPMGKVTINKTNVSTAIGDIGYVNESFRDFEITFQMRIEDYKDENYPSITMRSTAADPTYASGYTFIINNDNIELQKYGTGIADSWLFVGAPDNPKGIYGPAVFSDAFKMGEWNTITMGTRNEEKGVRIYLEVNGVVYYDYLDTVSTIDNAGTIAFCRNGVDRIEVRTVQK